MIFPFIATAPSGPPFVFRFLAQDSTRIFDQAGVGAAILLTLFGMILHWNLPRLRMEMEERIKDGKMTGEEARRHLRFYSRCAPVATLAGISVLLWVLFDLAR